jgi:hypothetical protein
VSQEKMNLSSIVVYELDKIRAMSLGDIRSMSEQTHRQVEMSWRCRASISIYAENVDHDAIRVIVKAFESHFPHIFTKAFADGFRVNRNGQIEGLTGTDKATLY